MLNQFLPQSVDNTYRGSKLALWLFGLLLLMKIAMSLNCIFNGSSVATNADGLPLDTYTPAGAQAVVSLFATWGVTHLMLCLIGLLVLVRYRSLIPFIFTLLLLEQLSRKLAQHFLPIVKTGAPPGTYVNLFLFALMAVGLALSLLPLRRAVR